MNENFIYFIAFIFLANALSPVKEGKSGSPRIIETTSQPV